MECSQAKAEWSNVKTERETLEQRLAIAKRRIKHLSARQNDERYRTELMDYYTAGAQYVESLKRLEKYLFEIGNEVVQEPAAPIAILGW